MRCACVFVISQTLKAVHQVDGAIHQLFHRQGIDADQKPLCCGGHIRDFRIQLSGSQENHPMSGSRSRAGRLELRPVRQKSAGKNIACHHPRAQAAGDKIRQQGERVFSSRIPAHAKARRFNRQDRLQTHFCSCRITDHNRIEVADFADPDTLKAHFRRRSLRPLTDCSNKTATPQHLSLGSVTNCPCGIAHYWKISKRCPSWMGAPRDNCIKGDAALNHRGQRADDQATRHLRRKKR